MPVRSELPFGAQTFIFSKLYYGVLNRKLEDLEIDRYFTAIYFISKNPGCTQQQICNALGIDKSGMVKVMRYLMKAGYVEKQINPRDKREHFLALTKLGTTRAKTVSDVFHKLDDQLFEGVNEADAEKFMELTRLFLSRISRMPFNDLFFEQKKSK